MKKLLTAIIVLAAFSSCSNYYKAITTTGKISTSSIEDLKMKDKYFILRDGNHAFAMKNISFSTDQKNMQCSLDSLPDEHKLHLTKGKNGKMKYNRPTNGDSRVESMVLNEVHVYTTPGGNITTGPYTIAIDKLQKIEVLEKDKIKTKKSYALGIGITVGVSLVATGLAAYSIATADYGISLY